MASAKTSPAETAQKIYALLEDLTSEERQRIVSSVMTLFGETAPQVSASNPGSVQPNPAAGVAQGAKAFFDAKNPGSKGEQLAVAARFAELSENKDSYSRDDLERIVKAARRSFDGRHFARDMDNARRQAGFFIAGNSRDTYALSHYGQSYVDVLPDKDAAAKLQRPRMKKAPAKKK